MWLRTRIHCEIKECGNQLLLNGCLNVCKLSQVDTEKDCPVEFRERVENDDDFALLEHGLHKENAILKTKLAEVDEVLTRVQSELLTLLVMQANYCYSQVADIDNPFTCDKHNLNEVILVTCIGCLQKQMEEYPIDLDKFNPDGSVRE